MPFSWKTLPMSVSPRWLIAMAVVLLLCSLQAFEWISHFPSQGSFTSPEAVSQLQRYRLKDEHAGSTFFDGFNFEDAADPTHGHVLYQNRRNAEMHNLTYLGSDGLSYIHVDSTSVAPHGRRSVRISTKKSYTRGLFVLDVTHMPEGCAVWPAFWTTAATSWPDKGEIDILEGVNLETSNAFTLHTSKGCRMAQYREQLGSSETMDCYVNAWGQWPNQGCGVKTPESFGTSFNLQKGKVVVMEWTKSTIRMWLFPRDSNPLPESADTYFGTEDWRTPDATFDDTECDIENMFKDHVVILNASLCGDWAGNTYASSSCPGMDCAAFVTHNPAEFKDAYWAINSLKIYQVG